MENSMKVKILFSITALLLLASHSETAGPCDNIQPDGECRCTNNCLKLPPELTGCVNCNNIVEEVMKLIKESRILPTGYNFTRRIAYVETRDGADNPDPSNLCPRRGIWGISNDMIFRMKETLDNDEGDTYKNLKEARQDVCNIFGIDVISNTNLGDPLVSGVTAHFYLHYKLTEESLPTDISNQATFWAKHYRDVRSNETEYRFINRVTELEGCKVNADIVFVLDISSSINQIKLNRVIDFVSRFVRNLTIGPDDDRVGVIFFGTDAYTKIRLTDYTESEELVRRIESLKNESVSHRSVKQYTNMAAGLFSARRMFESSNISSIGTTLKIVILVSDGKSANASVPTTIREAENLRNLNPSVQIFTIGVGGNINDQELKRIAGDSRRFTWLYSFSFNDVGDRYLMQLCTKGTLNVTGIDEVTGEIEKREIVRYGIIIPINGLTVKVCIQDGLVVLSLFTFVNGEPNADLSSQLDCANSEGSNCICADIYVQSPAANSTRRKREYKTTELYITIEGMAGKNKFTVNITNGDDSFDCVGQKVAAGCRDQTSTSTTPSIIGWQSDSSHSTTNPEEGAKHNTKKIIAVAVTTTGSVVFLIYSMVIVGVVIAWVVYRQQKHKKQKHEEDVEDKLLDNEYFEM